MNRTSNLQDTPINPRRLSKPKFILTLFLIIAVSASLIAGGAMSYFSMQSTSFISVNGREIVTPEVMSTIQSFMSQPGSNPQEKFSSVMQYLGAIQNSIMWVFYGKKQGLEFKETDIVEAIKPIYEETKSQYQKENKSYYNIPLASFVKQNLDHFNVQSIFGAINVPSTPDQYTLKLEYTAENTLSTVQYQYIDIYQYISNIYKNEIMEFYAKSKTPIIGGKKLSVISFDTQEEGDKAAEEFAKNKKIAQSKIALKKEEITIPNTSDAYTFIQNTKTGEVSPSFSFNQKYYVGIVQEDVALPFNELETADIKKYTQDYYKTLSQKEVDTIKTNIQNELKSNKSATYILKGTTRPINMTLSEDVKDSRSFDSLPFAATNNEEFFLEAFHKEGYISPILHYIDTYYKITVTKRSNPNYPPSEKRLTSLAETIKEKEERMWLAFHSNKMQNIVKTDVNTNNVNQLLGIPG